MQRQRLTPERIRRFTCPPDKQQAFLFDTEAPRLAVRVTVNGAKSFVFEGKLKRQTIRRTIGDCSAWTLEDARAKANALKVMLDQGTDPRQLDRERAAQRADKEREMQERKHFTLRALCEAYVRRLASQGKTKSAAAVASAFRCHVYPHRNLADLPAREVTPQQAAQLVRTVAETGKSRMAGILRSYLSTAFNDAKRAPLSAELPADLIPFGISANPVESVPAIAVNKGNRTLSGEELRAYLAQLGDSLPDQALRLALLAGGQRMAQLLRARVTDYWDDGILRLFDGKGKRRTPREHLLPLGPMAAALADSLAERARLRGTAELFCIGSTPMDTATPGGRVAEISAAMGGEPFDLRDIRRTCETLLNAVGVSKDIRAQLLSHGLGGIQATHYDRHDYIEEKHAALMAWEAFLSRTGAGHVVPLHRGA
ncbi:tyrosine-type recombinase/integrase [Immundisolibacter sp.]|uniref:tyrosine-type recombinase/integrase n=1 Tax=Immundisolibacter sp. TaxID=1934948 RepID=UPI003564FCEA